MRQGIRAVFVGGVGGDAGGGGQSTVGAVGVVGGGLGSSQVNLSWTAATDDFGVACVRVERCQGAGCSSFVAVTTVTTLAWSDTGRSPATSYSYRVRARDTAGQVGSYSGIATAVTQAAVDNPPSAPSGLSAAASGSSQVNLSWTAATDDFGVASYEVQRCQGAGCSGFVQVATTGSTSLADTGLQASTSYSYRVRARDTAAQAGASRTWPRRRRQPHHLPRRQTSSPPTRSTREQAPPSGTCPGTETTAPAGGASWSTLGRFGKALTFGGSGSLVQVPDANSLDLSTGMTLEAWVFPTGGSGWRDVIYKGGASDTYFLEGSSDSGPPAAGGAWGRRAVRVAALPLNVWSHLAGTYDGTSLRLYVNGVQVATRATSGSIPGSSGPLTIGGDLAYGQNFQGRIDEVRILPDRTDTGGDPDGHEQPGDAEPNGAEAGHHGPGCGVHGRRRHGQRDVHDDGQSHRGRSCPLPARRGAGEDGPDPRRRVRVLGYPRRLAHAERLARPRRPHQDIRQRRDARQLLERRRPCRSLASDRHDHCSRRRACPGRIGERRSGRQLGIYGVQFKLDGTTTASKPRRAVQRELGHHDDGNVAHT